MRRACSRALQRVEGEAKRMSGLVEDLLLLAELDRGRPMRVEPVDMRAICTDVVEDANAAEHGHQLSLVAGSPVIVMGDEERLVQIAHNLVRNALAHTPAGTTVEVSTHVSRGMGVLEVTDNGPGVSPGDTERVFDRFYQGDPSRSSHGTGLGLSIVRAIATALKGTASMTLPRGGGFSVQVTIPLAGRSTFTEELRRRADLTALSTPTPSPQVR